MCRLFGQISAAPANAFDFLAASERSLLRQGDAKPGNLQKDGWGVGYFAGDRAKIVKSPGAIYEESARFSRVASRIRSRVVVGHIRAASNPRGLPRKSLISMANTQPFTNGRFVFAHNGTLQIPSEVARFLGAYRRRLRGVNDSEVYFWQFVKFHDAYGNVPEALLACARETWAIWAGCKKRYPRKKAPYTGLNTLVADAGSLHALCHYRYGSPGLRSLYNPRQPWGVMSRAERGGRVVMASEDMDGKPWRHFSDAEIVSASIERGRVSVKRTRGGIC